MARKPRPCRKVTFHRPDGTAVTVERCDRRSLSDAARKRYNRDAAAGSVTRHARSGRFVDPFECELAKADCVEDRPRTKLPKAERKPKLCFRSKRELVQTIIDFNRHVVEPCERDSSGQSFDPVNHKYDRTGKKKVTSCEQAVAAVVPPGRPFCLERVDLKTLNELEVAKKHGNFRLPDPVQSWLATRDWKKRYGGEG